MATIGQSINRSPDHPITRYRKRLLYRSRTAPVDDVAEAADLEARAAHQRAVHVGLGNQIADIVRLDAPAVDHVAVIRGVGAEPLPNPHPDVRVRFAGLRGGRVPSGPD